MISKLIRFDVINTKQKSFIMKKIIALFVIMLGFGFTANAQQKKAAVKSAAVASTATPQQTAKAATIEKAAISDVESLNSFIPLKDADRQSLKGLFAYKHELLSDAALSKERKDIVSQTIEAKLRATLSPEQMAKLDQNTKLLNTLTH
ncbi:hypothetical protein Q766_05300 [Flavobacterium subsaxonicum WB 4.1-42 = DSM 21790]|uniref:Uncharacterized protein n=2 Tax=Flavobacterium TaxID=237 RepID=A0A0A2MNS9_9FLAO|nr:hypothetical protein Q766_05300 [Flavobacterium subsaxonicum WB 4.1-42 = DSM 21790]